jgi:N-acetylglutamate synthase-like GNAT family acetyltransferase/DNA-binding MarR family transcriptional regulator
MNEDFIKELGYLGIATRLKRISEQMIHSGRQMYKLLNMDIEPNWYLIFKLLEKHETLSVTEMADKLRFAHPSVITIVKKMKDNGYLESYVNPDDTRKQQFKLSEKALQMLPKFKEVWACGMQGLDKIFKDDCLLKELEQLEDALNEKSFKDRTLENYFPKNGIKVIKFSPEYAVDFASLNYEWLNQYFEIEEHDREMLDEPEEYIINKGGQILLALNGENKAIGTVALLKEDDGVYELAKMAVTPRFKGFKIGNLLMEEAVKFAKHLGARTVFLESNRKLVPALNLYRKYGFIEVEHDANTPYARSDIKMELNLTNND